MDKKDIARQFKSLDEETRLGFDGKIRNPGTGPKTKEMLRRMRLKHDEICSTDKAATVGID